LIITFFIPCKTDTKTTEYIYNFYFEISARDKWVFLSLWRQWVRFHSSGIQKNQHTLMTLFLIHWIFIHEWINSFIISLRNFHPNHLLSLNPEVHFCGNLWIHLQLWISWLILSWKSLESVSFIQNCKDQKDLDNGKTVSSIESKYI
jgi:hypothetical protein